MAKGVGVRNEVRGWRKRSVLGLGMRYEVRGKEHWGEI